MGRRINFYSSGQLTNRIHNKTFEYAGFLYTKQEILQTLRLPSEVPEIRTNNSLLFSLLSFLFRFVE